MRNNPALTVGETTAIANDVLESRGIPVVPLGVADGTWSPVIAAPVWTDDDIDLPATLEWVVPYFGSRCAVVIGTDTSDSICEGILLFGRELAHIPVADAPRMA